MTKLEGKSYSPVDSCVNCYWGGEPLSELKMVCCSCVGSDHFRHYVSLGHPDCGLWVPGFKFKGDEPTLEQLLKEKGMTSWIERWALSKHPKDAPPGKNDYKCGHCGYEGPCYGVPTGEGITAPFCKQCGRNDKLTKSESV